jgi:glycosyltransferase involved in cell wall biosynthesis
MQSASMFVLLSKKPSERLPNVIKEALWAGCAVISSRSDGIEELIPDASIGFVVDADDHSAVSAIVTKLLQESEQQADRRRRRARAFVKDHYSSDASMRSYAEAWLRAKTTLERSRKKESSPEPAKRLARYSASSPTRSQSDAAGQVS